MLSFGLYSHSIAKKSKVDTKRSVAVSDPIFNKFFKALAKVLSLEDVTPQPNSNPQQHEANFALKKEILENSEFRNIIKDSFQARRV